MLLFVEGTVTKLDYSWLNEKSRMYHYRYHNYLPFHLLSQYQLYTKLYRRTCGSKYLAYYITATSKQSSILYKSSLRFSCTVQARKGISTPSRGGGGGVVILQVASCYENRVYKLWPIGYPVARLRLEPADNLNFVQGL